MNVFRFFLSSFVSVAYINDNCMGTRNYSIHDIIIHIYRITNAQCTHDVWKGHTLNCKHAMYLCNCNKLINNGQCVLGISRAIIVVRMTDFGRQDFYDFCRIGSETLTIVWPVPHTYHDNQSINMYRDSRKHQIKLKKIQYTHILLSISWYQINKRTTEPELILQYLDIQVPTI